MAFGLGAEPGPLLRNVPNPKSLKRMPSELGVNPKPSGLLLVACLLLVPRLGAAEDAKDVLDGVGKAMGEVTSLQYSGSGAFFSLGQSFAPGEPWPRFGLKSYTRTIDYETPALRDEVVRASAWPRPARSDPPSR